MAARDSYGRLLALLAASTSDLAAAEDALADAFERALRTWPSQGVPASPDAWLLTVARNRLRDQWKSARAQRTVPLDAAQDALAPFADVDVDSIPDRRLELMLVCAHPAVDRAAHTPLMLNTVLGFTAEQVGRAFSVPPSTMATRLVRAKKRIKAAGIPFRLPERADLPARMNSVLEAVYGAYVIDWATGPQARQLPSEALHLAEVLTTLVPGDPEARGLAALIELSAARAPARVDADGQFVPLADQDPSQWDQHLISRAHEHLRAAHAQGQLGRFQLEAAIQAVHCAGTTGPGTTGPGTTGPGTTGPGDSMTPPTGQRCSPCTASCILSRPRSAAVSPSPSSPPKSRGPQRDWPHSTRCWPRPASGPASSSQPKPPGPTCLTGSAAGKRPPLLMKARSA